MPRIFGERMSDLKPSASSERSADTRKDIAVKFLNMIGAGRPKEGLRFCASECKTHNPYVTGGMNELVDAMLEVQKKGAEGIIKGSNADFKLVVRNVLAEGDLVAVHTQLSSPDPFDGGLRQVHLFRFSADKIVEYWDITQQVPEKAPNAAAAFS
jgi:predicted SnoaL-like aldol condensation-catalyzing enzyme